MKAIVLTDKQIEAVKIGLATFVDMHDALVPQCQSVEEVVALNDVNKELAEVLKTL